MLSNPPNASSVLQRTSFFMIIICAPVPILRSDSKMFCTRGKNNLNNVTFSNIPKFAIKQKQTVNYAGLSIK